ncbi:hypothetical protein [Halomarina litorea]|uniref:hypothetical protein n=1 Tax=Halomarina litorea TaxID=2961595 RepID=UPI0020C34D9F|nr:hypothetical protein [Halomarina sp. BCD28]
MATSPHLVRDDDQLKLDVSVGTHRRQLVLSDAAVNLLREQGYGPADIVPWVTTKTLVLSDGASLPEGSDARDVSWDITGADGGRQADETELRALADYLRGRTVADRSLDTLREHVRRTGLSRFLDPDELQGRAEKVRGLNDIARGL